MCRAVDLISIDNRSFQAASDTRKRLDDLIASFQQHGANAPSPDDGDVDGQGHWRTSTDGGEDGGAYQSSSTASKPRESERASTSAQAAAKGESLVAYMDREGLSRRVSFATQFRILLARWFLLMFRDKKAFVSHLAQAVGMVSAP